MLIRCRRVLNQRLRKSSRNLQCRIDPLTHVQLERIDSVRDEVAAAPFDHLEVFQLGVCGRLPHRLNARYHKVRNAVVDLVQ